MKIAGLAGIAGRRIVFSGAIVAVALLLAPGLEAQESPVVAAALPSLQEQVRVVGQRDSIYGIPGSAHYIDFEEIRSLGYDDINRVLQAVPGVYLREEDGYGLFPNISLRGVDTSRSAKVTLMEDGILAAPAPYAAPAAYYSPTTGRMNGLEVLKGSSQVRYGPHITGGVINYLSTPIPDQRQVFLRTQYGSDNDLRVHGIFGDSVRTASGTFGYLLEGYLRDTDGFKTIDRAPGARGRGDTGFHNIEPMIKLSFEPATALPQRFEFKYGYTDKVADETYLGLTTADFRADPYRRYAASRFDEIETEQHRTYLRHFISLTGSLDVVTTLYYNSFARNWYKLNDILAAPGGLSANSSLSAALAGAGEGLACLRGELACGLRVRANSREYYAWGAQSEASFEFSSGVLSHRLNAGVRYHEDVEDRFQHDDVYAQEADGSVSGVTRGLPGSQDNREAETGAVALWLHDTIDIGNWRFTPGIRYEHLALDNRDFRPGRVSSDTTLSMLAGGVAAAYRIGDDWQIFGGVHFGFSPPAPGDAVAGLNEESSVGYELGVRYGSPGRVLTAEAVAFHTAFDDLIVVSNIGGTGTGLTENFGKVESRGLELSGRFDLGRAAGWPFSNPWFVAFTWTEAEQRNDARSTDPESIFSFGSRGNRVPYIPEYQLTIGSSVEFNRWGASLSASFVDQTFTSASNVRTEVNGLGQPDARFGMTDAYAIVDLSVHARLREELRLFAGAHNLFDEEYIVSRQPHGPRPGLPRSWFVGMEWAF
jgi:Fe(3+) dicitrate transport protein